MMDYVQKQKELMNNIYKETIDNQNFLIKLMKDDESINPNIYGLDLINSSKVNLNKKYDDFTRDLYSIQKHKFRFQVSTLIQFKNINFVSKYPL